ncbi:hypothetical protein AB6A40_008209 [Gnathostoma spinigerum]|uniref:Uncharacterized protein n=1 Tax=Gnathostoma spinigerum TaxID=75299 RepID=A0ABD6ENF4_9BILA
MDYYNGKIHEKLADENRAASKKYLQQIRQSSRHCHPPLEPPSMLHRTHSGAQKRIRQRQEQLWQRTASSPSPSPSVDQPEVHKGCTTYRSLVESCAYRSILPENCEEDVPVVSHSRPISSAPITHSTSLTSLNSIPGTSFADITSNAIPVTTEKPMVEVRPLLVTPQQCNGQPYMSRQLVDRGHRDGEKPLVPKKPQRLISQNAKPLCCSPTLSRSTPHLNVDLNSSNDHISRLYCTPSLWGLHKEMSLPNHSNQDMIRIEAKRQEVNG